MKYNKVVSLFSLLLFLGAATHAQNDVLRLKDGSFIRGTIIEYITGDHVKIKTEEGKYYEFPAADVLRVDGGNGPVARLPKVFEVKTKGYYNILGVGLMFGSRYGININPGIYMVNGWQWNAHLMTGIGMGVEYMYDGGKFPLTADVRWKFLEGRISPYVQVNCGYTVASRGHGYYYDWWGNGDVLRNYGGITSGASVGVLSHSGPHVGIVMSAGYRFQMLKTRYNEYTWLNGNEPVVHEVTTKSYLNRFTLGFGLLFN